MSNIITNKVLNQCIEILSAENLLLKEKIIDPLVIYFKKKIWWFYVIVTILLILMLISNVIIIFKLYVLVNKFTNNISL